MFLFAADLCPYRTRVTVVSGVLVAKTFVGVMHAPPEQLVGVARGVGVSHNTLGGQVGVGDTQPVPGPQVGVATLVDVASLVFVGVPQPPLGQPGVFVGVGVSQRVLGGHVGVGVAQSVPGPQVGVGTLVSVGLGVPQFTFGAQVGVANTVRVGKGVPQPPLGQPGVFVGVGVPQFVLGMQVGVGVAQPVPGPHVGVATLVDVAFRVFVGNGVPHAPPEQPVGDGRGVGVPHSVLGGHVGVPRTVRVGSGVPHPPLGQSGVFVGVGVSQRVLGGQVGVGVAQSVPGAQVGVATRVSVETGVLHPPNTHSVGDGRGVAVPQFVLGAQVGVTVTVPQNVPGVQRVGSGLPVGVTLRTPVGFGVEVLPDGFVGEPQTVPGSQRVGSTVMNGIGRRSGSPWVGSAVGLLPGTKATTVGTEIVGARVGVGSGLSGRLMSSRAAPIMTAAATSKVSVPMAKYERVALPGWRSSPCRTMRS